MGYAEFYTTEAYLEWQEKHPNAVIALETHTCIGTWEIYYYDS